MENLETKNEQQQDKVQEEEIQEEEKSNSFKDILKLLKPTKEFYVTPVIIYVNILVFLIMSIGGVSPFSPTAEALLNWGGNLKILTLNGDYWRLLSSVFVHGGILHLLFNAYALLHIGILLEPLLGNKKFLSSYICAGVMASIVSIAFNDNIVSVGASGAIFGMYGLFLAFILLKVLNMPSESMQSLRSSIFSFIGYNLVFGFTIDGIDNAAHIGGLVSGFFIGVAYAISIKKPNILKFVTIIIPVLVIGLVSFLPQVLGNKLGEFQSVMEEFGENEEKAVAMLQYDFRLDNKYLYKDELALLENEGMALWEKNLSLLESLDDMPEHLQTRIYLLKEYCELRKETIQIILKDGTGNIFGPHSTILENQKKINEIFEKLELLNQ
ncbi:rhomboid family intramembrane serine protease [Flammeovirga aprica]|uniref:Rhomboid family intramembrane serine protease n=1 Tax=Flammeovirga aprica JL-4 TaxID=694437 RepID=A0A7X9P303_9BACT|nr:rhomboid family intramembrane serine protease [Flammeovirga aprica]NME68604.1 rhomboid family intramembrane serine protease [Flammeovirga aprica JL-4]